MYLYVYNIIFTHMLHGQSIYNTIYLHHSSIVQMIIVIWFHLLLRVEVALAAGIQDLVVKKSCDCLLNSF